MQWKSNKNYFSTVAKDSLRIILNGIELSIVSKLSTRCIFCSWSLKMPICHQTLAKQELGLGSSTQPATVYLARSFKFHDKSIKYQAKQQIIIFAAYWSRVYTTNSFFVSTKDLVSLTKTFCTIHATQTRKKVANNEDWKLMREIIRQV